MLTSPQFGNEWSRSNESALQRLMHENDAYIEEHENINPPVKLISDLYEKSNIEAIIHQGDNLKNFSAKVQHKMKQFTVFLMGERLMLERKLDGGAQKTRKFHDKWEDRDKIWKSATKRVDSDFNDASPAKRQRWASKTGQKLSSAVLLSPLEAGYASPYEIDHTKYSRVSGSMQGANIIPTISDDVPGPERRQVHNITDIRFADQHKSVTSSYQAPKPSIKRSWSQANSSQVLDSNQNLTLTAHLDKKQLDSENVDASPRMVEDNFHLIETSNTSMPATSARDTPQPYRQPTPTSFRPIIDTSAFTSSKAPLSVASTLCMELPTGDAVTMDEQWTLKTISDLTVTGLFNLFAVQFKVVATKLAGLEFQAMFSKRLMIQIRKGDSDKVWELKVDLLDTWVANARKAEETGKQFNFVVRILW